MALDLLVVFWWSSFPCLWLLTRVGGSVAFLLAVFFYGNRVLAFPFPTFIHLVGILMLARQSAPVQTGGRHSRYERSSDMGSGYVSLTSLRHGPDYILD